MVRLGHGHDALLAQSVRAELITPWSLVPQHEALGYRRLTSTPVLSIHGEWGDGAMDGIAAFGPFSLG